MSLVQTLARSPDHSSRVISLNQSLMSTAAAAYSQKVARQIPLSVTTVLPPQT